MIAFDTNLLVRFLVDDNKSQADLAEALLQANTVFISRTVLLETEWVLRSRYHQQRNQLEILIDQLLNSENVLLEDSEQIARALEWYRHGADFADALHLAACGNAIMHTFDQGFCRAARKAGLTPEIRILEAKQ
jgi:predicted nucleic-acid-binding protein